MIRKYIDDHNFFIQDKYSYRDVTLRFKVPYSYTQKYAEAARFGTISINSNGEPIIYLDRKEVREIVTDFENLVNIKEGTTLYSIDIVYANFNGDKDMVKKIKHHMEIPLRHYRGFEVVTAAEYNQLMQHKPKVENNQFYRVCIRQQNQRVTIACGFPSIDRAKGWAKHLACKYEIVKH